MQIRSFAWSMVALAGCAVAPEDELDESQTSSPLVMADRAGWNGTTPLFLGNLADETCFLSGVSGSLSGTPALFEGQTAPPHIADVRVVADTPTGKWKVITEWGTGPGVQAGVVCVNVPFTAANHAKEFFWENNDPSSGPYTASPNTHCFLGEVWSTVGMNGELGDDGTPTTIRLVSTPQGGNLVWDLNHSHVHRDFHHNVFAGATARCIDFPANASWHFGFAGPANAVSTIPLRDSYPSGNVIPTTNIPCALTGIRGNWISPASDPLGMLDGAILDPSQASWSINISNNRGAEVTCVR